MTEFTNIVDDPMQYGSKGQTWAPEFVKYMKEIVTHSEYAEMPDAIKEDGKIQWEAPSNRSGGKYQFTHNKRRKWWKNKAISIGVDTSVDQWISRTAKLIHPTGTKPCKRCGRTIYIAYVYPKMNLKKRFYKYLDEDFEISEFDHLIPILLRAHELYGARLIQSIKKILQSKGILIPDMRNDFDELIRWVKDEYIPKEPSTLSPGVMSNAPDRFDGFHSFNRCCRSSADKGRHNTNLRRYTTDRRVFEFWSDGDWIAADRLMGLVKSEMRDEGCSDGGAGPPTADHIGPISLGFCHRPEFRLLSKSANSAKNNRMTLEDVRYLLDCESRKINVASWHAKPLWDLRKFDVENEEQSRRLSKMLRDNQRNAMHQLCILYGANYHTYLAHLLNLEYANRNVEFMNLRSNNFLTHYDKINFEIRDTKYSNEQKARRVRIGFDALQKYLEAENRHAIIVAEDCVGAYISEACKMLADAPTEIRKLDYDIAQALFPSDGEFSEDRLRKVVSIFPLDKIELFDKVNVLLVKAMACVGNHLNNMWNDDRYTRDDQL